MPHNSSKTNALLQEPERNFALLFIFMAVFLTACIFCLYKTHLFQAMLETCYILIMTMTTLIILELIKRCFYYFDGLMKLKTENEGNSSEIFKASFSFNTFSTVTITLCFVLLMILILNLHNGQTSLSIYHVKNSTFVIPNIKYFFLAIIFAFCFSYFLMDFIKINECRAQKLQILHELGGLTYGSSMACSYFFGYLKIILPPDGKENEGFRGRITNFADDHKVEVPVKKLFILIPASLYIPTDLNETSDWLEVVENLQFKYSVIMNRAGVHKRDYKNTIYKLTPGGIGSKETPIHVVTEGATPLLTFFETQHYSHRYAAIYREFKKEIVHSFYRTLQNLLNDNPDCRHVCELVYYNDYDANGRKVNPGKILLERIKENMINDL